jgi:hypothetical protein
MDDGEVGTLDVDFGAAVVGDVALVCPELHSPRPRQTRKINVNDASRGRLSRARTERTVTSGHRGGEAYDDRPAHTRRPTP